MFDQREQTVHGPQTNVAGDVNTGGGFVNTGSISSGGDVIGRDKIVYNYPPPPEPSKARVFVGYEPQDPAAADVAKQLIARLERDGCEVLTLTVVEGPVARWRDDLYSVLGYAHAAVLVLSPGALISDLFAQACSLLSVRRYTADDTFVLQPVLLDPLTPAALQHTPLEPLAGFVPIQGGNAEMIVGQLSEQLASLQAAPPTTLLEVLANNVAKILRAFGSGDLKDLLKRIGWAPDDSPELATQVALALWRRRFTYELTPPLIRSLGQSKLKELVGCIVPSWVDPWAARGILLAVGPNVRVPQVRAVGVAGVGDVDAEFVGRSYWRRAYCAADPLGKMITVNNSSAPGGAAPLRHEIRAAVAREVRLDAAAPNDRLRTAIMQRMTKPAFVVVPPPLLHPDEIQRLLSDDTFASILFIFLNDSLLAPDAMAAYSGVLFLQPATDPNEVEGAIEMYYQFS